MKRKNITRFLVVLLALSTLTGLGVAAAGLISGGKPLNPAPEIIYDDGKNTVEYADDTAGAQSQQSSSSSSSGSLSSGSVTLTLGYSLYVRGYAANISAALSGYSFVGNPVSVYLDVNGQKLGLTSMTSGSVTLAVTAAQMTVPAGFYYVKAEDTDGNLIAQAQLEITNVPLHLWVPDVIRSADGNITVIFPEYIAAAQGTSLSAQIISVQDNYQQNSPISINPGNMSVNIAFPYDDLKESAGTVDNSDKIKITGLRYPRLFPSYYFTFTISFIKGADHSLTVENGEDYYLAVSALEFPNTGNSEYTVLYDPAVLDCLEAAGAGVNLLENRNGVLIFTLSRPEEDPSGILSLLRFQAKTDGDTTVTVKARPAN